MKFKKIDENSIRVIQNYEYSTDYVGNSIITGDWCYEDTPEEVKLGKFYLDKIEILENDIR